MTVHTLTVGPFESNCYLVEEKGFCLLLDPGADAEQVIRATPSVPVAILLTHGHIDHISALPRLHAVWPETPIFLHAADLAWAFQPTNAIPPYYESVHLKAGRVLPLPAAQWAGGPFVWTLLPAPGHTPGGVCFYHSESASVFTGDTLFEGTVGRTDLPGSDARALNDSLQLLAALPPETRVYPGHGASTTIARELTNNFFLSAAARRNAG